jgi:hypothetical protein
MVPKASIFSKIGSWRKNRLEKRRRAMIKKSVDNAFKDFKKDAEKQLRKSRR